MAHEDWDLFAIVRSYKTNFAPITEIPSPTSTTIIQDTNPCLANFTVSQENDSFSFPNLVQPRTNEFQELHQLLMNSNPTTPTSTTSTSGNSINPNSTFSNLAGFIGQHHPLPVPPPNYPSIGGSTTGLERFHHQQQQPQPQPKAQQPQPPEQQQQQQHNELQVQVPQASSSSIVLPNTQPQTPRSRKRKSQQKKMVCHVTADNVSSDFWAWRKYGQKPIKGSPHPRNYYRCSSCKGCAARKQVERSTTEPNMFMVTYTGDHKHAKPAHRNSLAGSTRNKPSTTRLPDIHQTGSSSNEGNVNPSSSQFSPIQLKPASPEKNGALVAVREPDDPDPKTEPDLASEDDDDVLIPNTTAMLDTVFLGLHHFDGGGGGGGVTRANRNTKPAGGSDPTTYLV
ncbi:probable WRKY transcription factor 27 [Gastrolobium bilobum]|uniref:probable WRKY transcription factor 27 n=1 Tax=Gastrolobium bilobum TaxID=150636 RepID=UPI002AAFC71D|nr:probable WRKY transcription factor 27 [Gastrolobium bilobum]